MGIPMEQINWLYVSRQFNRSGFYILQHLLKEGTYKPFAVLLPKTSKNNPLDDPDEAKKEVERYYREVAYFGCKPLRFLKSIRLLAQEYGIEVFERESIKGSACYEWLQSLSIDLIVLAGGWPELIPRRVISLPRLGIINTHPSLLPYYRGTDIHRWQIMYGVRQSGITIHYVDESFDTGPILGQVTVDITPKDTPQDLAEKTAKAGGPLMSCVLSQLFSVAPNRLDGTPQTDRDDTRRYFHRWRWFDRDFLRLDWNRPAIELAQFILACTQESYQYNGPYFCLREKEFIVREADIVANDVPGKPGDVLEIDEYVVIYCHLGAQALRLLKIQPSNKDGWENGRHTEPVLSSSKVFRSEKISIGDNLLDIA